MKIIGFIIFLFYTLNNFICKSSNKIRQIPSTAFMPNATLPGEKITVEGLNVSMIIPTNWTHRWDANKVDYIISPPDLNPSIESIRLYTKNITAQDTIKELLSKELGNIMKMSPIPLRTTPVIGPEEFTINKNRAGRYIARANALGVLNYEGYMGVVLDEETKMAYHLTGAYLDIKSKKYRPGLDTILSSISLS
jgi:hypothetical protein